MLSGRTATMRAVILFAALVSVALAAVEAQNSYLNALKHGQAAHQGRHGRSAPLQRSSSEQSINRSPKHGGYNNNNNYGGRSRSLDRGSGGGGSCSTNYRIDWIQLTLQWGPGFCATSPKHCVKKVNSFTVHGVWPQTRDQYSSPEFCCFDNTFYFKEIEHLVKDLEKYWFSYYSQNSRGFWSHEWLKHGTCFRDVAKLQGEDLYFGNTLGLMKRLDILGALNKNGVVPGPNKVYNSQSVINAIRSLTGGKSVQIDCDLEAHQPVPILTGINICMDKNLDWINCPPSKSRCSREVMFLDR